MMFVCAMTGMALTAIPVDASAKCPVATAVVTGSLDLPREMDRVAVGVFLDNFESGRLVWLDSLCIRRRRQQKPKRQEKSPAHHPSPGASIVTRLFLGDLRAGDSIFVT